MKGPRTIVDAVRERHHDASFRERARGLFSCVTLVFVFVFGVALARPFFRALKVVSGRTITEDVQSGLAENFPRKGDFIDINGGVARLIGRRMCNERMLYGDGSVGYQFAQRHSQVECFIESVVDFSGRVRDLGCAFLYVQAPAKMPLCGDFMPEGWDFENPNLVGSAVVGGLTGSGVNALDLIPEFAGSPEDVSRNFFRTDHHWRTHAAFRAANLVVGELSSMFSAGDLRNPPQLESDRWAKVVLPQSFLGSHGRRTGRFFAGLDDFEYLVPTFKSDISRIVPGRPPRRGSFEAAVLNMRVLKRRTVRDRNMYGMHGQDLGQLSFVNMHAPSAVRVLIVKDSFANPVAAFLTTVCREVTVVDPRKCSSWAQVIALIANCRPDVVIEMVNPVAVFSGKYVFKSNENG